MKSLPFGPANPSWSLFASALLVLVVLLITTAAHGLITVGQGNDPVHDQNWPAGSVDVANLKTRLGWWEGPPFGGGQHQFVYAGDTAAFQAALDQFAKIRSTSLPLIIHEGPHTDTFVENPKDPKAKARVDWTFTVWNAESYNHLYNNPNSVFSAIDPSNRFRSSVEPPRLDVYLGGVPAGQGIDWTKVRIPKAVTVTDERASANGYAPGSGSVIRGNVFDIATQKPISGAKVSIETLKNPNDRSYTQVQSAAADAAGHYELSKIPTGSYRLVARADGYVSRMLAYVSCGTDTLKQIDTRLAAPGPVKGTVIDTDGKPVANVGVRADSTMSADGRGYLLLDPAEATSDAQGHFTLANVPRGYLQLYASADGYLGKDILKVYAAPDDGLVLRVAATGNVKGKISKAGTVPQGNFMASIKPEGGEVPGSWGGSATIAPDGTFSFEGVPPGKYIVSIRLNPGPAEQKGTPAQPIEIQPGKTLELSFDVR